MIDRLIDKLFDFDVNTDHTRTILTGGWIILFAFLILLFDSGLLIGAVLVALVGIGFAVGGIYNMKKEK